MDDFMQKLMALRDRVGDVAKGTFNNMRGAGERSQEIVDAKRAQNEELITNAFGSPEAYMELQNSTSTPPLPPTPGESMDGFFDRIRALREPVYYQNKK